MNKEYFDIVAENIENNSNLFEKLNEAINEMKTYTLKDKFEVVLNNNLIEIKEKLSGFKTILGCRISYEDLDKNISFIVREDNKPSYEELEQENKELNDYIVKQHLDHPETLLYGLNNAMERFERFYNIDKESWKEQMFELQERIDKAIEYIEYYCIGNLEYENKTHKRLLEILKGSEK